MPPVSYQFAPAPKIAIEDGQLCDGAFRAFCVMLSIRSGDRCKISERRLGEKLGKSERTAHKYIHELIDAGYIEALDPRNGTCGKYAFPLLKPASDFSSSTRLKDQGLQKPVLASANGFSGTPANGFSQPRVSDILPREGIEKEKESAQRRERCRVPLTELLDRMEGTPEERGCVAEQLLRWWPSDLMLRHVAGAVRYPSLANLKTLVDFVRRQMLARSLSASDTCKRTA